LYTQPRTRTRGCTPTCGRPNTRTRAGCTRTCTWQWDTRGRETATSARHPQVRGDSGSWGGEHPVLTYGDYTNLIGYMGFTRSSVHLRYCLGAIVALLRRRHRECHARGAPDSAKWRSTLGFLVRQLANSGGLSTARLINDQRLVDDRLTTLI